MDELSIQRELLYIFSERKKIQDEKIKLSYELERLEIARMRQLIQEERARLVQQIQNLADYEEESEDEDSEGETDRNSDVTNQRVTNQRVTNQRVTNIVDKSIQNNNNKIDLLHKIEIYYSRKGLSLPFGIRMYTLEQLHSHWNKHCCA